MSKIADLLQAARDAHARFQQADGSIHTDGRVKTLPDPVLRRREAESALTARQHAESLDPRHGDPAWSADQAANRGVASSSLLEFFSDYLRTH